jgi:hypothetical protein
MLPNKELKLTKPSMMELRSVLRARAHVRGTMCRIRGISLVTLAPTVLLACNQFGPDVQPIQLAFTSVQASAPPCHGPSPTPPCSPQYFVGVSAQMRVISGDPLTVQSFVAELYDIHGARAAIPADSQPSTPFTVSEAATDAHLLFIAPPGAEVKGGSIRLVLVGVNGHGLSWEQKAETVVPR